MAIGTIIDGTNTTIQVATATGPVAGVYTAGTYKDCDGLTAWNKRNQVATTKKTIYMRATQITSRGRPNRTVTLSGVESIGDDGQLILRAAAESGDVIAVKVLPDGTAGWEMFGTVSNNEDAGPNPDDNPTASWDIDLVTSPTVVSTGL